MESKIKSEIKRHSLHKLLFTVPRYSIQNKNLVGEDERATSADMVALVALCIMGIIISPFVMESVPTHPLFWIMYSAVIGGIGYFLAMMTLLPKIYVDLNKTEIYLGDDIIANVLCDENVLNKVLDYKVTLVLQEKTGSRRFTEDSAYRYHYYYEEILYQANTIHNSPIHFTIPKFLFPSVATNSIQNVNETKYKKPIKRLMQDLGLTTDLSVGTDVFLEWGLVIEAKLKYKRTVKRIFFFTVLAPETENQHDSKSELEYF